MFEFLHGKKEAESGAEQSGSDPEYANGTSIAYHPELIEHFESEHKQLLQLFQNMVDAIEQDDVETTSKHLKKFSLLLRGHLLEENIKLYVYLQHTLINDVESTELVNSFKSEMQAIGRSVNKFITSYSKENWSAEDIENFKREIKPIGNILVERINNEEEMLYKLYMPPGNYS